MLVCHLLMVMLVEDQSLFSLDKELLGAISGPQALCLTSLAYIVKGCMYNYNKENLNELIITFFFTPHSTKYFVLQI